MFDFADLEQILQDARAGCRAAECHGFICAQICIAGILDEDLLTEYLLGNEIDNGEINECRNYLTSLADATAEQFSSPEIELELLMPGEDVSLKIRGVALTEWCQGFLSGVGIAGLGSDGIMSAESKELVDDLYKISRLDTDNLGDEDSQDEYDLMELVEYVRMGVILIYDEFHNLQSNRELPEILH